MVIDQPLGSLQAITSYFSNDPATGEPTREGQWLPADTTASVELGPGLLARPLTGGRMMLTHVEWSAGAHAPEHSHEEEQIVLVLAGAVEFELAGSTRVLGPGDSVVVPPWTKHSARAAAAHCVTVEGFAPPRAALLALLAGDRP